MCCTKKSSKSITKNRATCSTDHCAVAISFISITLVCFFGLQRDRILLNSAKTMDWKDPGGPWGKTEIKQRAQHNTQFFFFFKFPAGVFKIENVKHAFVHIWISCETIVAWNKFTRECSRSPTQQEMTLWCRTD